MQSLLLLVECFPFLCVFAVALLFFALINACRLYGIDPENALERTNKKFIKRFNHIEARAAEQDKLVSDLNLEQMESYWQEAKKL